MRSWLIFAAVACGGSQPDVTVPSNRTSEPGPAPSPRVEPATGMAATWIERLDDPQQRDRAIAELEQLGDPSAIEPLGNLWVADRSVRALQVVISLARPLTPADAKARFVTDYEQTGRPASWERARTYLVRALADLDANDPRSVDAAVKAADALGEAKLAAAVPSLLVVAARPVSKKTITAQIAAIRALGKHAAEKATVGPALGKMIDVDPPRHPRTATSKAEARPLEEAFMMHLARVGAAINALGELHVQTETKALVLALYRTPELATQVRRALVASGPVARDALLEVLAGKHVAVEALFKAKKLGRYCGDRDELPAAGCQRVALRDFYAAIVLGDLRDPRAVPALLAVLKRPATPAYYTEDQPGPTQYSAVFDALRKIGGRDSAKPLLAMWKDRRADVQARIGAMETYGIVARDATGAKELGQIAADNGADDGLRLAAATTLARISIDKLDVSLFLQLAAKYLDASAKKRKAADSTRAAADAAEQPLAAARQDLETAKATLIAATKDPGATADRIRTLTQNAKQAEVAFKAAKRKHREITMPHRQANQAAQAYKGFARIFQTHVAQIDIALRCKDSLDCHAATLKLTIDRAAQQLSTYIKDASSWTKDEKLRLVEAAVERSMIELGKRGIKASAHSGVLLDAVVSDNRVIRQSILLALPKITVVPCGVCVAKLDAAVVAGEGKATLADLAVETTLVRNYFAWAGGRVP